MRTLQELCPGVTKTGDFLTYEVRSKSRPGVKHRVDFTCWGGYGACSCEHFTLKVAPLLREGIKPTRAMECDCITKARRYLAIEATQAAIAQRMQAANHNRKAHGRREVTYENDLSPI